MEEMKNGGENAKGDFSVSEQSNSLILSCKMYFTHHGKLKEIFHHHHHHQTNQILHQHLVDSV